MNIFKVAKKFQKKLSLATNEVYKKVTEVRNAAKNLCQPNIKDLWMNAAGPYAEDQVTAALQKIDNYSKMYYDAAFNKGMSAQQHGTFISKLQEGLDELQTAQLATNLDPIASDKVSALKNVVNESANSYVPTYVAPYNDNSSGNSYFQDKTLDQNQGASSEDLEGVVNQLSSQNDPPVGGVGSPVDWENQE